MNEWYIAIIIIVAILVGGGLFFFLARSRKDSTEEPSRYLTDDEPATGITAEDQARSSIEVDRERAEPGAGADIAIADDDTTDTSAPAATLERPESVLSRMQRLRARLARSGSFGRALLSILSRDTLTEEDWEELEDTLLMADVGIDPTTELLDKLRRESHVVSDSDTESIRDLLRRELLELVDPEMDRSLNLDAGIADDGSPHPASVLVVGVNGTGKTTTVGKLARVLVAEDKHVILGAADTFRAAAAEQLATWAARVGVDVVRSEKEGADPASVAFDAVQQGADNGVDVVIVDTAGRLQNKAGLMDQLGKIKRVMERRAPVREVLLVLDATTGQNGMQQARVFAEAVNITGIVLTKLDGTAKGGIVMAVQRELGVPVKLVGLGEGADDLSPFVPEDFVDSLLDTSETE